MMIKERLKKFGAPLLAGMVLVAGIGGFAGVKVFAASQQDVKPVKQEATEQAPAYKASITLGQQDNTKDEKKDQAKDEKNDPALTAKAKITGEQAISAVKSAYPENTVKQADLGDENGNLIYDVNMTDKSGKSFDVKVDAGNARILAVDGDQGEEGSGLQEANGESAQDNEKPEGSTNAPDTDNVNVEE